MNDATERLLSQLDKVTQIGDRKWKACCPAHDDKNPSLSIEQTSDGKVLINCRSQKCDPRAIVEAVGLTLADLFCDSQGFTASTKPNARPRESKTIFEKLNTAIVAVAKNLGNPSDRWSYHDVEGNHVLEVIRWDSADGSKEFRPVTRNGEGWFIGADNSNRPLYRLPEIINADRVFVCEGEKATDAACSIGLTATTSSGGSGAAEKTDWTPLAGKEVVILPDGDEAGRKYAEEVASILLQLDTPATVKIPERFEVADKSIKGVDIADWLEERDAVELETLRKVIEEMVIATVEHSSASSTEKPDENRTRFKIKTISAAELASLEINDDWLIEDVIVRGQPGGFFGPAKSCKTTLATELALSLARGGQFLGMFNVPQAVRVGFLSAESGEATTKDNFIRIAKESVWTNLSDYENLRIGFKVPTLADPGHLMAIEEFITEWQIECLVCDPFYLMAGGLGDGAGNLLKMGEALWPLSELCQKFGVTILVCHHLRKNRKEQFAIPELEDIAWSGFQEWLRQWILLNRREAYDEDASPGTHKLWFRFGGSAGFGGVRGIDISEGLRSDPGGRHWKLEVLSVSDVKAGSMSETELRKQQSEERKLEASKDRIRKAAKRIGEPDTKTAIRNTAGMNPSQFEPAFLLLIDDGEFVPVEVVKNGKTHTGFHYSNSQDSEEQQKNVLLRSG